MNTKRVVGLLLCVFTAAALADGKPIRLQSQELLPAGEIVANLDRLRAAKPNHAALHVIVQFDAVPTPAQRQQLEAQGVRLLHYLPDNAFFASVDGRTPAAQLHGKFRWLGGVEIADKMPRRVRQTGLGQWAKRAGDTVELRVKLFAGIAPATGTAAIEALGGHVLKTEAELCRLTVNLPAAKLDALADLDAVRWVEEAPPPPSTNNDGARVNVQATLLESAPYNLTGAGVALGEWDEAHVDPAHADFAGRLITGDTAGTSSHSTHVAGTMAGNGTLSASAGGTALQWRGMATNATIVTHDWNSNITEHNAAINTYSIVLSQNSWMYTVSSGYGNCALYGNYGADAPEYDEIVTGLYGRGINIIFAAGNERDDGDCHLTNGAPNYLNYRCVGPPATAKNMLSIGAINSDDNSIAYFSSWGPVDDGRLKPELVAPGDQAGGDGGIKSTLPGNTYGVYIGTSMAAPAMSGCIGLLVEDYRALFGGTNPVPALVRALFIHTALDLDDDTSWFNKGPDYASGYGRVQVKAAVEQVRSNGFLVATIGHSQTNLHTFAVPAGTTNVKFTLVWDDPAAVENAALALVNDLDLVVTDPNNVRRYPWTLDPANPPATAVQTGEDHTNVIEQVSVETGVVAGLWSVRVVGRNVPVNAPQTYALVFSPPAPASQLALVLPASASESVGTVTGVVSIPTAQTNDVPVTLASSDTTEATVPATITILAGQTNASFDVTIVNDADLDATQTATITATAANYLAGAAAINVLDDETAMLTVSLPANVTEGAGAVTGTVFVSTPVTVDFAVALTSSDPTELTVPVGVTVVAGQTQAVFVATVVNDALIDGMQAVTVTAHVAGWTDGLASVDVLDNEPVNLVVTLTGVAREGAGLLTNAGVVRISGVLPADLPVNLVSSDLTELTVPASVTIGAGQTSAVFAVTVVDDSESDGAQSVTVTASAGGFTDGAATWTVWDNEVDHFTWATISGTRTGGVPFSVNVSARDVGNLAISNYPGPVMLSAAGDGGPNPMLPLTSGAFANGAWAGSVTISNLDSNVRLFASDGSGHSGTSTAFDVVQAVVHHFTWSALGATQYVEAPFGVTLTARDVANNVATNFGGTANLSVIRSGSVQITNVLLGSALPAFTNTTAVRTVGYSFTPTNEWTVTHWRHYAGTKVGLWTDTGTVLATDSVASIVGTWTETALTTGIVLHAGIRYRVGVFTGSEPSFWRTNLAANFVSGTIHQSYRDDGDVFPNTPDPARWFLVDLRFQGGVVPLTPPVTGEFTNGVWSGALTVLGASTNLQLLAALPTRQFGTSTVFRTIYRGAVALNLPATVREGDGVLSSTGRVSVAVAPAADLLVQLVSSNTTELIVPASVTILAGQTNVSFNVTVGDDAVLDGSQAVSVWAGATSYQATNRTVTVTDNETATLTLNVPATAIEGGASVTGMVSISSAPAANVAITLLSSDTTEATVPATVTVAAGQTSTNFLINLPNDTLLDGPQPVTLTARVTGWTDGTAVLSVLDNESTNLTIMVPALLTEGVNNTGSVSISGTLPSALMVNLSSSDLTELTVPATVTIAAGQVTTSFPVTVVDDTETDGDQPVTITAGASGFVPGTAATTVRDNDLHHFTWAVISGTPTAGAPFSVSVSGRDVVDRVTSNFTGTAGLSAVGDGGTMALAPLSTTAFVSGTWTGAVVIAVSGTNVRLTANDGAGHTGQSAPFTVAAGPLDHFAISSVATTQRVEVPFAVTVTAQDAASNTVNSFTGTVGMSATTGISTNVGTGTGAWSFPLYTFYHDARTQVIYLRDELGGPKRISALALDVTTLPAQTMNNWTIRLKHSPLTNYATATWDASGWTVVYQTNQSITTTGWVNFVFSQPFDYNGTDSLMVDFSFNNSSYTSSGASRYTATSQSRSLYFYTDSGYGDPLTWSGSSPSGSLIAQIPNVRLIAAASGTSLTPTNTGNFVAGVWTGSVSVLAPATNVFLRAEDSMGHGGYGNAFNVIYTGALALTVPGSATEGDGVLSGQGQVAVTPAPVADLVVSLQSGDASELTVPATVTIPAGQTNVSFDVTIGDDADLDGSQPTTVHASSAGYPAAFQILVVHDNDTATLTLDVPVSAVEGGASLAGAVVVSAPVATNVTVTLTSSDVTEATVPASVVILPGQTSVVFNASFPDDTLIDGTQSATITAHVTGWTDATANISILDNEATNLVLTLPSSAYENAGTLTNAGRVRISGTLPGDLVVGLVSGDTSELVVPASVTIAAGQTSVVFNVVIVDDAELDGTQPAPVTASAAGFTDGNATVNVLDSDAHHFTWLGIASPQTSGVPFTVSVTARDVADLIMSNFPGPVSLTATGDHGVVVLSNAVSGAFVNGTWTGSVRVVTADTGVQLVADDGSGHTGASGAFDVVPGAVHHFVWSSLGATQNVSTPIPVTVIAQDSGGNTVSFFTNSVYLSALTGTLTGQVCGTVSGTSSAGVVFGNVVAGERYTFSSSGSIAFNYSGCRTDADGAIAAGACAATSNAPSGFICTGLRAWSLVGKVGGNCVQLGTVGAFVAPATGVLTLYYNDDGFGDNNGSFSVCIGAGSAVSLTPTITGPFTAGIWSGTVTILEPVTNVFIRADDGSGQRGDSNPFRAVSTGNLALELPANVTEGVGLLAATGQVNLTTAPATDVPVTFTVSELGEVVLPASVVVPAGQTNVVFDLGVVDDAIVDGSRAITVRALASGYVSTNLVMWVHDNEAVTLTLTLPASVTEEEGVVTGQVFASVIMATNVPVGLASSDLTELTVPAMVTIPVGQTSAVFTATVINDIEIDGTQPVTVTASVQNWIPGVASITVFDNEPTNLVVTLPASAYEGRGTITNGGTVRIGGTLPAPLTVSLLSSDTTELAVPPSVSIAAGQTSVVFNVAIVDDSELDGTQPATVTASAAGFSPGSAMLNVFDNDLHHFAWGAVSSPKTAAVPFSVSVTAYDLNNLIISNYAGPALITGAGDGGPVGVAPAVSGAFSNGVWSSSLVVSNNDTNVRLTASDGAGQTGLSAAFDVLVGALHHLAISPVASPQYVGLATPVTVTAQDAGNNTVTTFTNSATLAAWSHGEFDQVCVSVLGNSSGGTAVVAVVAGHVYSYQASGCIANATGGSSYTNPDGLHSTNSCSAYYLGTVPATSAFVCPGLNELSLVGKVGGNCIQLGSSGVFTSPASGTLTLHYNDQNFVDNSGSFSVCIGAGTPVSLTPTNTGLFVAGTWSGNFTIWQPAWDVTLIATEAGGKSGTGNVFQAEYISPLLVTVPSRVGENAGVVAATVSVTSAPPANLTVALSSSELSAATLPASVVILAGQTNAGFNISIVDDGLLDGTWPATVTALAPGYQNGTATILVDDDETAALALELPASATEGMLVTGRVFCSAAAGTNVTVNLSSSDTSEVAVPATVGIAKGATQAVFAATIVDETLIDGTQSATVTAHVENWGEAAATITVFDNEATVLTLSVPAWVREGQGTLSGTGKVFISGTLLTNLTVNLSSSDTSELTVTDLVTIAVGQTSAVFNVTVIDDTELDGVQSVTVDATAAGFPAANALVLVLDNDVQHYAWAAVGSVQTAGVPFAVTVTALDVNGLVISNHAGPAILTGTGTSGAANVWPLMTGLFANGVWTGAVRVNNIDTGIQLTASDGSGHAGQSAPFTVVGGGLDHFAWSAVAASQTVGVAFPVTVIAQDAGNNPVASFTGPATLHGQRAAPVSVSGSGSGLLSYPVGSTSPQVRTQSLYLTNQVGTARQLTALWLEVYMPLSSPVTYQNWTVRLKHTALTTGTGMQWQTNEWTTVCQTNMPVSSASSIRFPFVIPFEYNGTSNLLVDLSYNGMSGSLYIAYTRGTLASGSRTYYATLSGYPDPLTWSPGNPNGALSSYTPNIRFEGVETVPINPTNAAEFVNGMWTGNLSVLTTAASMWLHADDGVGHTGIGNVFSTYGPVQTNSWLQATGGNWQDAPAWSLGIAPAADQVIFITNATTKTVLADAQTLAQAATTLVVNTLRVDGPNTLQLAALPTATPLRVQTDCRIGAAGNLDLTNAALVVNGGAVGGTSGRMFAFARPLTGNPSLSELAWTNSPFSRTLPLPVAPLSSANTIGLAAGPNSLFYIDGYGSGPHILWELDPETGAVLDADIVDAGFSSPIDGAAYLNGRVYLQRAQTNEILVWDPALDQVVAQFSISGDISGGLTGSTSDGWLYATGGGRVYRLDPSTGQVVGPVLTAPNTLISGLALLNGDLYSGSSLPTYWYRSSPITGTIWSSLYLGSANLFALGGEGAPNSAPALVVDGTAVMRGGSILVTNGTTVVGAAGTGAFIALDGTFRTAGLIVGMQAGAHGALTMAGTTNTIAQQFSIGHALGATGEVWFNSGTLSVLNGATVVGQAGVGSLTVAGGSFLYRDLILGNQSNACGTVQLTGGLLRGTELVIGHLATNTNAVWVTAGDLQTTAGLYVGYAGPGRLTLSNGTASAANQSVGVKAGATGMLAISGGTNLVTGGLTLGTDAGATGTVAVAAGLLQATNAIFGAQGTGHLIISGGSAQFNAVTLGDCAGTGSGNLTVTGGLVTVTGTLDLRNGTFTLAGGTAVVNTLVITNSCARFVRTGGTLSVGVRILAVGMDADGDGLPNEWEQATGLDPLSPADPPDPDGDGFTNLQEYSAGTLPLSAQSVPAIVAITIEDGTVHVWLPSVAGKTYQLQRGVALNAANWSDLGPATPGTGALLELPDPAPPTPAFYRVKITP
ncbi:MAG: hypothetical protein PCFJNLEI_03795 [Verrucomicrobiae bacterium]|nr:hypothetical protein [Verrucomicrobiae bacterium]